MTSWFLFGHVACIALGALASLVEFRTGHIHNLLPASVLLVGLAVAIGDRAWSAHLLGFVASLPILWLWKRELVGGGGAKLFIGFGMTMGWPDVGILWPLLLSAFAVLWARSRWTHRAWFMPVAPVVTISAALVTLVRWQG